MKRIKFTEELRLVRDAFDSRRALYYDLGNSPVLCTQYARKALGFPPRCSLPELVKVTVTNYYRKGAVKMTFREWWSAHSLHRSHKIRLNGRQHIIHHRLEQLLIAEFGSPDETGYDLYVSAKPV